EHVYQVQILKIEGDLWQLSGSSTGYQGSNQLSPFIRWLVQHAGGRYLIQQDRYVIQNPKWKPGEVWDGYFAPEHSVLFANEFHNWSKQLTDAFLKQALDQ